MVATSTAWAGGAVDADWLVNASVASPSDLEAMNTTDFAERSVYTPKALESMPKAQTVDVGEHISRSTHRAVSGARAAPTGAKRVSGAKAAPSGARRVSGARTLGGAR